MSAFSWILILILQGGKRGVLVGATYALWGITTVVSKRCIARAFMAKVA